MRKSYTNSGYSSGGASIERPTLKTWRPSHYSSKSDIELNLGLLRSRAYDLAINSPLGSAAIGAMVTGTIGAGLRVFPQVRSGELGLSAELARAWGRRVKLEFERWARSLEVDFYRRNNFYELQRVLYTASLADGDSFCVFRRGRGGSSSLRLQGLEAARVSNPQTGGRVNPVETQLESGRIINGIEVDEQGRQRAIWVASRIWNEPLESRELKWQRVRLFGEHGTRNVLQICYDTRPGQFRGVPLLGAVIETLKQISRYADAELTSSIIKSFFSLFFIQPSSSYDINDILSEEPVVDVREYQLGSGTISALPRGVDVKSVESSSAHSTFDPFVTQFSKQIGAAIGLPYEVLLKNFQSSYSASKAALLEAEKEFRQRRAAFINDFLQPVYELWLAEMVALGRITAPGFFDNDFARYLWSQADWRGGVRFTANFRRI